MNDFTPKKFMAIIILLGIIVTSLLIYDDYTQSSRLTKMERVTAIVERLHGLNESGAFSEQPELEQTYAWLKQELLFLTSIDRSSDSSGYSIFNRVILGGILWFVLAIVAATAIFNKVSRNRKRAGAVFGILVVPGFISGIFVHLATPSDASSLTLILFSLLPFVFLTIAIGIILPALGAARRTARQMADLQKGRQLRAASRKYRAKQSGDNRITPGDLIEDNLISFDGIVSAENEKIRKSEYDSLPVAERAKWASRSADFIILPEAMNSEEQNEIAIVMRPGVYKDHKGGVVIYCDGRGEIVKDYSDIDGQFFAQTGHKITGFKQVVGD
ncbi:MAG: hypothetical protein AAFX76_03295 [Planctomycetota bacterium]